MGDAEQIDLLRARVFASMPSKQRLPPRPVVRQSEEDREEGELSSSDDDQVLPSPLPGTVHLHGQPLNASRLGTPLQVSLKDNMNKLGDTSPANILKTEVAISATNVSIVNKSQLLSGLNASAPPLGSIKRPIEVGISDFEPAIRKQRQPTRGERTPQGQLHPVVRKLSPAAPVYTLKENETGTGVVLTHVQKRVRYEEALRVPQGNSRFPAASQGASRLPSVSPKTPSPSSGGTSSSSGSPFQPVSVPAACTEADVFLANLSLPVNTGSKPCQRHDNLIIKFGDSDSDGEQQQLEFTRSQVSQFGNEEVGSLRGKQSASTRAPSQSTIQIGGRKDRIVNMEQSKVKNNVFQKTVFPSPLTSKSSIPNMNEIETLRQRIREKEKEKENAIREHKEKEKEIAIREQREKEIAIRERKEKENVTQEQENQVKENELQDQRCFVLSGAPAPGPAFGQKSGDMLDLKTSSKVSFNKKSGVLNASYVDPSLSRPHLNEPERTGVGQRNGGDPVLPRSMPKVQVMQKPLEESHVDHHHKLTVHRVMNPESAGLTATKRDGRSSLPCAASTGLRPASVLEASSLKESVRDISTVSPITRGIITANVAIGGLASESVVVSDPSDVENMHKLLNASDRSVTQRAGFDSPTVKESAATQLMANEPELLSFLNVKEVKGFEGPDSGQRGAQLGSKCSVMTMEPFIDQYKNFPVDLNFKPLPLPQMTVPIATECPAYPALRVMTPMASSGHEADPLTKRPRTQGFFTSMSDTKKTAAVNSVSLLSPLPVEGSNAYLALPGSEPLISFHSEVRAHPNITSSVAGVQHMGRDGIQVLALPSMELKNIPLQFSNPCRLTSPDPSAPGSCSSLQQFEPAGSALEELGMQGNISGGKARHSLQHLQQEEANIDEALEEAQVNRRQCEVRERETRRAHREAQVALSSANSLCEALLQRRKWLSAQVHAAEYQMVQQPTFSLNNSLVPFNCGTGPQITELSPPALPSTASDIGQQFPGQELNFGKLSKSNLGNIPPTNHGNRSHTHAAHDERMARGSSKSVDAISWETNYDNVPHQGIQMLNVQRSGDIPGSVEVATGGLESLSHIVQAEDSSIHAEVPASKDSEAAAPLHSTNIQSYSKLAMLSNVTPRAVLLSRDGVDLQDGIQVQVSSNLHEHSRTVQEKIKVPGSTSRGYTSLVPIINGQLETGKIDGDAQVFFPDGSGSPTSSLIEDKLPLKQPSNGEALASSRTSLPYQNTVILESSAVLEDAAQTKKSFSSMAKSDKSSGQDVFKVPKFQRRDRILPNVEGDGVVNEADHDMNGLTAEDKNQQVAPFSNPSPEDIFSDLEHISQVNGKENHKEHLSLIRRAKGKREICGLKALSENAEHKEVNVLVFATNSEEVTVDMEVDNLGTTSIFDSRGLTAEHAACVDTDSVQLQGYTALPRASEPRDMEDYVSRVSISSKGGTECSKEVDVAREEVVELVLRDSTKETVDRVDDESQSIGGSVAHHGVTVAIEAHGNTDGEELSGEADKGVGNDLSVGFEVKQLPSTVLSVAFCSFQTENVTTQSLGYDQVEQEKGSDQCTFLLETYESPLSMFRSYRMCGQLKQPWHKSLTSHTWSHMLDPCKPLCKFEHRGKCNNDLCPWQHVMDYTLDEADLVSQLSRYLDSGQHVEIQEKSPEAVKIELEEIVSNSHISFGDIISKKSLQPRNLPWNRGSPVSIYKIGSYLVNEGDAQSRVRCCLGNQFKVDFSSYTITSAMRRPLYPDILCLPAALSSIDSQTTGADASGWRYLGDASLASTEDHVRDNPGDVEAWLELALVQIDFDLNCTDTDAYNKALFVLSRALEANPTVSTLWVVYIGLYYQDKNEIGNDDLFSHAINHSKGSYELLLLYINSRAMLTDRLKAYELALESLTTNRPLGSQEEHSACILDLVIQMLDCMCVSKMTSLLHSWADDLANTEDMSVSLLACLTSKDCCIMRVACAYAVTFGHLPQDVILRVGCKQQLPMEIDWDRRSQLQEGSKELALKLMQASVSCASVLAQQESQKAMAVNYLQCLVLFCGIDGALQVGWELIGKHPACIELVLLVVRMESEQGWMKVFKQAVQNWPDTSAGQQRLWNQYAVHMLQIEGNSAALHILHQCAAAAAQSVSHEGLLMHDFSSSQEEVTRKALQLNASRCEKADGSPSQSGEDAEFAWMNLAIFEMLLGNTSDAYIALEKSMKEALRKEDACHCWKEMAAFTRLRKGCHKQVHYVNDLLDRCSVQVHLMCKLTPLASRLPASISKRRVRIFLESLIGPAPIDHSLVNSVVEIIIGKEPRFTKDVIQIIEAVLEVFPGNFELVLPFCRLLTDNLRNVTDMAVAVWASSLLLSSLLQACPQAHEQDWVEAGHLIAQLQDEVLLRSFFQFALALHPFSATLRSSFALLQDAKTPEYF